MEYSPGPWSIECESGNDHEAFVIVNKDRTIAWTCNTYDPVTDEEFISEEDRSNAELIALAPALYGTLEMLLERLTDGRFSVSKDAMEEWAEDIRRVLS